MHRPVLAVCSSSLCAVLAAQTNFPAPPAPTGNPVTTDKALLGMALFFEEQMSSSRTVACATCHDFAAGGADPRTGASRHPGYDGVFGTADDVAGAIGVPGLAAAGNQANERFGFAPQVTSRRSPTVVNAAYHPSLFYDGRATEGSFRDPVTNQVLLTGPVALENLVLQPPLNPVEMGHAGRTWPQVAQQLAASQPLALASNLPPRLQQFVAGNDYPALFATAFGTAEVTPARIVMAIATYLRTLNADQSKYDRYLAGLTGLSAQEQHGLSLFNTPRNGAVSCRSCHGDFEARVRQEGPIAGQMTMVTTGYYGAPVPTRLLFHNIGLRPNHEDPGRQGISQVSTDAGRFRTAALRNVELTAPYFHNGSAATLRDALTFYNRGGDFHVNQSPSLLPRNYTEAELDALEAILKTLTDPRLVAGQAPFDRPRLGSTTGRFVPAIGPGLTTLGGRPVVAHAPRPADLGDSAFSLTLSGVTPGAFTMLLFDFVGQEPNAGTLNLVVGLSPNLLVVPTGPATAVGTQGVKQVAMPLPADAGLRGLTFFAQWISLEPGVESDLITSNGLRIELH